MRLFATSRDVLVECGILVINQFGEYITKANFDHKKIKVYYELAKDVIKFPIQGGVLLIGNTIPILSFKNTSY